jgi:sulfonate transport system substrate-binding protein
MISRLTRIVAVGTVAAAAVLASPVQAAEKINVFSGVSPIFAPPFIADVKGYFKEEGLDVTVRTFQAGMEATESFRTGGAQFLVNCDQAMLIMAASGGAVISAQFSKNDHMLTIVAPKAMSGPADLKGKKIGLVRRSASEYLLERYLQQAGLSTKDVEMVNLAPFDQVPAIVRGDVYAISSWKPLDSKVYALSNNFKEVANPRSMGYALYCGMLTSRKYLETVDEETVNKFMRAIKKGSDFLTNNPEEGIATIAKFTRLPADEVAYVVKGQSWDLVIDEPFREQLRNIEKFLLAHKLIPNPVNWETAVDWSHIKRLDPNLVKGK